jgi:hypothetical protein
MVTNARLTRPAHYQIRRDDFSKDFATAFGASLRDSYWSDPAVHGSFRRPKS